LEEPWTVTDVTSSYNCRFEKKEKMKRKPGRERRGKASDRGKSVLLLGLVDWLKCDEPEGLNLRRCRGPAAASGQIHRAATERKKKKKALSVREERETVSAVGISRRGKLSDFPWVKRCSKTGKRGESVPGVERRERSRKRSSRTGKFLAKDPKASDQGGGLSKGKKQHRRIYRCNRSGPSQIRYRAETV